MRHRVLGRVRIVGSLGALVALALAGSAAADSQTRADPGTVHLRGTVYTFDNQNPIAGATVKIAELPDLAAVTHADGTYDLAVPDGSRITPYVEAAGHHGIFLQTFITAGADIERVNFQIPSTGVYTGLAFLLNVELDAANEPVRCVIVSTFSTANVRDVSFDDFVAYGAHGVAGATASTVPALPNPIYFNESVLPDPSRTESSDDGGVIWTEVPTGTYRVAAQHPTERFAEFTAECLPGRLINANPPQGLYQLRPGEELDKKVVAKLEKAKFSRSGKHRRTLKLKTSSPEYVAVDAVLKRKRKQLAASKPGDGIGDYAAGRKKLSLKVKRSTDAGRVKLLVTFTDAAENERTVVKKLKLPETRG